jgi:hypothetical protein
MNYLMFVCMDETVTPDPEDLAGMGERTQSWVDEMDGRGVRLQGQRLRPQQDATTVSVRAGEVVVADGPFAETKEQIAGFDILACADLDEAIEVASKHPVARVGTLELRPFWEE